VIHLLFTFFLLNTLFLWNYLFLLKQWLFESIKLAIAVVNSCVFNHDFPHGKFLQFKQCLLVLSVKF